MIASDSPRLVAYLRVSTDGQGRSGIDLKTQCAVVALRLETCRTLRARLVIARLARNAALVSSFVKCGAETATAEVAEEEARLAPARTNAALAVAKERGGTARQPAASGWILRDRLASRRGAQCAQHEARRGDQTVRGAREVGGRIVLA